MAGLGNFFNSLFGKGDIKPMLYRPGMLPSNKDYSIYSPEIQDFIVTNNYNNLPENWSKNENILAQLGDLYQRYGINSPAFKAWNEGNLLTPGKVWFHGTPVKFDTFDRSKNPTGLISAFLTDDPSTAAYYANGGGRLIDVYARSKNPIFIEGGDRDWLKFNRFKITGASPEVKATLANINPYFNGIGSKDIFVNDIYRLAPNLMEDYTFRPTDNFAANAFNKLNADGVVINNYTDGGSYPANSVILKDPNQVKGVANSGGFDIRDNRFTRGLIGGGVGLGLLSAVNAQADELERIKRADKPLEDAWNPIESLVTAPIGALGLAGGLANFFGDMVLSNIPVNPTSSYDKVNTNRQLQFGE